MSDKRVNETKSWVGMRGDIETEEERVFFFWHSDYLNEKMLCIRKLSFQGIVFFSLLSPFRLYAIH